MTESKHTALRPRYTPDRRTWISLLIAGFVLAGCGAANEATAPLALATGSILFELATFLRGKEKQVRSLAGPLRIEVLANPMDSASPPSESRLIDPKTASLRQDAGEAKATLRISENGLRELMAGKANGMELMLREEAQFSGDLMLLMQLDSLFPQTQEPNAQQQSSSTDSTDNLALARIALFDEWGATFPDGRQNRLFPAMSAILTGLPRWPRREQYIVARIGANTIIATDGLTDTPLPGDDDAPDGFGIEVWGETDEPLSAPARSWLAALVAAVGYQVAAGTLRVEYFARQPGFISFEIPIADMKFDGQWPKSMTTPRDTVAMLIGLRSPTRPDVLREPFDAIRYLNVRLITPTELDSLRADGLTAAQRIAAQGPASRLQ